MDEINKQEKDLEQVKDQDQEQVKEQDRFLTISDYVEGNKKLKDWIISLINTNKQEKQVEEPKKDNKELPDF